MYEFTWNDIGTGRDFDSWMPISACRNISNFDGEVPEGWPVDGQEDSYEYDIWFKAYDTSIGHNRMDIEAYKQGYLFNCQVMIRGNDTGYLGNLVYPNPVPCKTKEDAVCYFESVRDKLERGEIDVARQYEIGLL